MAVSKEQPFLCIDPVLISFLPVQICFYASVINIGTVLSKNYYHLSAAIKGAGFRIRAVRLPAVKNFFISR